MSSRRSLFSKGRALFLKHLNAEFARARAIIVQMPVTHMQLFEQRHALDRINSIHFMPFAMYAKLEPCCAQKYADYNHRFATMFGRCYLITIAALTCLPSAGASACRFLIALVGYYGYDYAPIGYYGYNYAPVGYYVYNYATIGYYGYDYAPVGYYGYDYAPVGYYGYDYAPVGYCRDDNALVGYHGYDYAPGSRLRLKTILHGRQSGCEL
eukprot:6213094-Pleurochrysis_carterae.AAC.1